MDGLDLSKIYDAGKFAAKLLGYNDAQIDLGWTLLGGYSAQNQQKSYTKQIDYENYLKSANQRALDDWNKNVGYKGRSIKYPELSYSGQINRSNTAIARNELDYANAGASYLSNLPYRTAGLYGIAGKLSRTL